MAVGLRGTIQYLALIRGINVGGKNIVSMSQLRNCLNDTGLENVATYIQSGNLLFESSIRSTEKLAKLLEHELEKELLEAPQVVVVSQEQLEKVVSKAPPRFLVDTANHRLDVAFVKPPREASEILPMIRLKEGVDEAFAANGVLYLMRLTAKASESKLPQLTANPAYKSMTIRNWNTTTKLLALMRDR